MPVSSYHPAKNDLEEFDHAYEAYDLVKHLEGVKIKDSQRKGSNIESRSEVRQEQSRQKYEQIAGAYGVVSDQKLKEKMKKEVAKRKEVARKQSMERLEKKSVRSKEGSTKVKSVRKAGVKHVKNRKSATPVEGSAAAAGSPTRNTKLSEAPLHNSCPSHVTEPVSATTVSPTPRRKSLRPVAGSARDTARGDNSRAGPVAYRPDQNSVALIKNNVARIVASAIHDDLIRAARTAGKSKSRFRRKQRIDELEMQPVFAKADVLINNDQNCAVILCDGECLEF